MADKTLASGLHVMLNNAYQEKLENKMFKHKRKPKRIGNATIMMIILQTSALLILSSVSTFLLAENLPTTPTKSTGTVSEKTDPKNANTNNNDKTKKTTVLAAPKTATRGQKEVYKPTERVSEDNYDIRFPVDI